MDFTGFRDINGNSIFLNDEVKFDGKVFDVFPYDNKVLISNDDDEYVSYELAEVHEQCEVIMADYRLSEVFEDVKSLSFEKGKEHILSLYPKVEQNENFDDHEGLYDYDFVFGDTLITFTIPYADREELNYNEGYWQLTD